MQEKNQSVFLGRFSYLLTDFCGNLLFCIIGAYLLYFFTDVYGLPVAVTGTLLLVTRVLDCLDAPIWGSIIDHTKSRYGKSRLSSCGLQFHLLFLCGQHLQHLHFYLKQERLYMPF